MGPMAGIPVELRDEIQKTLEFYGQALESQDGDLLARARPDLGAAERQQCLAPFVGALNVATDLRVLEVTMTTDSATVSVLRTDVIVGGKHGAARPPTEETLRFVQVKDGWTLAVDRSR